MKIYFYIKNILLIILITACSSSIRFTKENDQLPKSKTGEQVTTEQPIVYRNYDVIQTEIGTASYYAEKFHGKLTANGEIYDMNGLTAAHPTLPLGTIIRVTNLENNKELTIRVNDRMPKHPSRIIDLSLGTAKELDMIGSGLTEVKIEVLEMGDNKYKNQY
jgi:rare lipoprotein A